MLITFVPAMFRILKWGRCTRLDLHFRTQLSPTVILNASAFVQEIVRKAILLAIVGTVVHSHSRGGGRIIIIIIISII